MLGLTQFLFLYIVVDAVRGGSGKATGQVWDSAEGLEWTLPSPTPLHTFHKPPQVD